jgi:4-hydroxy-tetrahydrodipicolinate synthase
VKRAPNQALILYLSLMVLLITIARLALGDTMFKGSYVALVTPMNEQGAVDYGSLEKLVQFHIEQGTDGIVSVGTTGESATVPFDEHREVVKKTVEYAQGKIPVIAGNGANSTEEAVFLSKQMCNLGLAGFLSVVPYYNKPQQRGLIAHFETIANATDIPVLLYNVPGRTVLDMNTDTVAQLANHRYIVGLKDATGDIERLRQTKKVVPTDFCCLSGDDTTSADFLNSGGDGVISVTANIVPNAMANMCSAARSQNSEKVFSIDREIAELHIQLFVESNPVIPKWALYRMGLIASPTLRLPMVLPESENKRQIEQLLQSLKLI